LSFKQYTVIELEIIIDVYEEYRTRLFHLLKQKITDYFVITDICVKDSLVTVGFKHWNKDVDDSKFSYLTFTEDDLNDEHICS
jgi:hypothetical protein